MLRGEVFLTAFDMLQSGHSLEVLGEYGSGRTHLLQRLRAHFITLGWHVIEVSGIEAFQRSPFAAIALTGLTDLVENRHSPAVAAVRVLSDQVKPGRTVVLVDDADWVDEASWGAVSAVSSKLGVPVLFTRSVHSAEPLLGIRPANGFTVVFSLTLPAMSYAELEATIENHLETKIEPSTMSRVYAKSAGNIGTAINIIDAGKRGGNIVLEHGMLRATGQLWTSSLSALAKIILQPLSGKETKALRALALLGTAELETASKLVPERQILALEEKSYITLFDQSERRHVALHPPLLLEYFRHEATPGQRAKVLGRIDGSLADLGSAGEISESAPEDHVIMVRLSHERTRLRTLSARESWRKLPNLSTAAEFLVALEADSSSSEEELQSLILRASELEGTDEQHADWDLAWGLHLVYQKGNAEEGIRHIEQAAVRFPAEAERLVAQTVLLQTSFGQLPENEPFTDITADSGSTSAALTARILWLLVSGRVLEADELLSSCDLGLSADPRLVGIAIFTKLAMGDWLDAERLVDQHLAAARSDFDASRLRVFTFFKAISAFFTHRFEDAEQALADAASLGVPSEETPVSFLGLSILNAFFAVQRGQRTLTKQYLDTLDELGYPDASLPGLQRAVATGRQLKLDGDRKSAAKELVEAGNALWERGARLAAAYLYLDGIQIEPNPELWAGVLPRLKQVDSPVFVAWSEFVDQLVARDVDGVANTVAQIQFKRHGINAPQLAQRALDALGSDAPDGSGLRELQAIASGKKQAAPTNQVELTARELEVAELIASGLSNPRIAEALVVSTRTVESHVNRLMKKLGTQQRRDIRAYLLATGLWS